MDVLKSTEIYALEYGFVRNSSRMSFPRPCLSLFAGGYPKLASAQGVFVALRAESPCGGTVPSVAGLRVEYNELSIAFYSGDGYVRRYVARGQALCQPLVQVWLLSSLSRRNRGVLTEMAASALSVCFKRMVVGSRLPTAREHPSDDPLRYKTVLDFLGCVVNFGSCQAPHLRVRLPGCVPECAESHVLFPSDARPWCCHDRRFVAHQREPT